MEASHADNSVHFPTEADRAREVILYAKNEADISFDYETQDVGVADPWPQRVLYGCQCKIHYVCVRQWYAERHIKLIQYQKCRVAHRRREATLYAPTIRGDTPIREVVIGYAIVLDAVVLVLKGPWVRGMM